MSAVSTLDQGHEHANNATDYYARGLLVPAAEEHYKAAEAFQTCVDHSTDEHTKNTLRKLCTHHRAVGKDILRRIGKLKEEGKDPSLPQLSSTSPSVSKPNEAGPTPHVPLRGRNLESSTNTFDESFMVLHQQTESSGDDSPFDLFWKVTGEIMVNLSQPMSFQTAAMAALDAVENRSASSRAESVHILKGSTASISKSSMEKSLPLENEYRKANRAVETNDFSFDEEEYDSLDDFCLVPSTSDDSPATARLKKENTQLKSKLDSMEKQMASVHRQITLRNEQDQHLRDNIMLARKEAQRAMAASTSLANPSVHSMMNLAGMSLNGPQSAGGRDREAQLLRRTRELEEEVRTVRSENDKQKAMIAKFRERWERLKESAKRKKSAKAAGHSDSSVRERIDEDPEAEAAAAAEDSGKDGA
ncbi:hypothetical protein EW145_g5492 [Phellinidium pouzarii]|uniref:MIT domain-containing protein n=1 Tax=Phellinidium pouzarii TaxID=167371 RepID=A0A4S4L4K4_9AGAM|nr:hypothetical protein EW145_g5492 [Phellinidium pouzarii]